MSYFEGKKIAENITAFNREAGHSTPLNSLARRLMFSRLTDKDFENGKKFLSALQDAMHLRIQNVFEENGESKSERAINMGSIYMSVEATKEGKAIPNKYVPAMCRAYLSRESLMFFHRMTPVVFSSDHVEFRFSQRTPETMDYSGIDFNHALITAIYMSRLETGEKQINSIAVPHNHGFLLGQAQNAPPRHFFHDQYVIAGYKGNNGKAYSFGLKEIVSPEWSPSSWLNIKTFVNHKQFSSNQTRLFQMFSEVLSTSKCQEAFHDVGNTYITGMSPDNPDLVYETDLKFLKIFKSDEWKKEQEKAFAHIPKNELN